MSALKLLLGLLHGGARGADIGVRRVQRAAGVDGGEGHVDVGDGSIGLGSARNASAFSTATW